VYYDIALLNGVILWTINVHWVTCNTLNKGMFYHLSV